MGAFLSGLVLTVHAQSSITAGGASAASAAGVVNIPEVVLNIYNLALLFGGLLAFVMILYAAVKYTLQGGNPSAQSDAKDQITQAILGLALLLGAYVVLNTINPELTRLKLPTVRKVEAPKGEQLTLPLNRTFGCLAPNGIYACSPGRKNDCSDAVGCSAATPCQQMPASYCGTPGMPGAPPGTLPPAGPTLTNQSAQQMIDQMMGTKKNLLTIPGYVNWNGVQSSVLAELLGTVLACNCPVTITAGTNGVHANGACSHAGGFKIDFDDNTRVDTFIRGSYRSLPFRCDRRNANGTCAVETPGWASGSGGRYWRERTHWDMDYGCS